MTHDELQAIKARANAATPGEWSVVAINQLDAWPVGSLCVGYDQESGANIWVHIVPLTRDALVHARHDAAFIAAARTAVPALVAEVERLREELARLMSERDEARREADQVETQLRNRNADIAELRRQLAEAQARQVAAMSECDSLRGLLTACREAMGAADNEQLLEMCEDTASRTNE